MEHNHKRNHSCCVDGVASHLNQNNNPQKGGEFYYTCPMHPEIKSDKPGLCPECGMNLIEVKSQKSKVKSSDYDKHAGHSIRMFAKKFWVSLILTVPVLLSDMVRPHPHPERTDGVEVLLVVPQHRPAVTPEGRT